MTTAANRAGIPANEPEVRLIDVRDSDGRLVRKATEAEASDIVEKGLGYRRGKHEIRLTDEALGWRGASANKTTLGRRQERKRHHDERCFQWQPSLPVRNVSSNDRKN